MCSFFIKLNLHHYMAIIQVQRAIRDNYSTELEIFICTAANDCTSRKNATCTVPPGCTQRKITIHTVTASEAKNSLVGITGKAV